MISKELSDKFKLGSLLCTIMVVYRHSLNIQAFGGEEQLGFGVSFIETGISKLTEIAVPFFFLLSGFFFFRGSYYKNRAYVNMLQKKFHTLFIPFVFWNLCGAIPLLVFHQFPLEENRLAYLLDLLHSDWNGVLWYVRDIMTMMLLVPLYEWVFQVNRKWLYAIVVSVLFFYWVPVTTSWLSSEGMLFFFLGGIVQRYNGILYYKLPFWVVAFLLTGWMIACFGYPYLWGIHKYTTLLGLLVFWQLLAYLSCSLNQLLLRLAPYSFFIYVTHLYLVKGLKVFLAHFFYANAAAALISYFVVPVIIVLMIIFTGMIWGKIAPRSFAFATGGRG